MEYLGLNPQSIFQRIDEKIRRFRILAGLQDGVPTRMGHCQYSTWCVGRDETNTIILEILPYISNKY